MTSPAENITRHYGGDWRGSYGSFPTPGHSKSDRGMTVKDAPDAPDGVLINSLNGGDPIAVKDECRRLGLLPERVLSADGAWRQTGEYLYRDEQGAVLYRTVRKERTGDKKRFDAQRPDGRGGWTMGIRDVRRVLYRLPELIAADRDQIIYLTEGERKADKLAKMGFIATAVAFGAKGWRNEFAEPLAQRTVAILPDNDDEGRGFAQRARDSIHAAGGRPVIVELPNLPPKGDVVDWKGTADELRELTATALAQPESAAPKLVSATAFTMPSPQSIPVREWLFGRYLMRGMMTAAVAPGGVGKSTFISSLLLSLSSGRELLGKKIWGGPKTVWLWNLEDDALELSRSLAAAALHHGLSQADIAGRVFLDSAMEGSTLCTAVDDMSGFRILRPIFDAIVQELKAKGIDVLIIDPFVSSHEIDENHNSKIDKIAKAWIRVAKAADVAIVLVHHTRKLAGQKVTSELSRGAASLIDASRAALVLNRMDADEAERFGIEGEDERRRYFTVRDDKSNRAPAERADWFRIVSIDLGNGGEGPGDNIGVATPWSPPSAFDGLTVDHLYRVQLALAEGEWREHYQAENWAGRAVARVLDIGTETKGDRARISQLLRTWLAEGALTVVERKDKKSRDTKKFIEVGRWANDDSAPLKSSDAKSSGAVEQPSCFTTHDTPGPLKGPGCHGGAGGGGATAAVEQPASDKGRSRGTAGLFEHADGDGGEAVQ